MDNKQDDSDAVDGIELGNNGSNYTSANTPASAAAARIGKFTATGKVKLEFSDIRYSIQTKDTKTKAVVDKVVLNDLSGIVQPSTMMAIMGPTGSGKTSLLNVLAHRVPFSKKAKLTGHLAVNGKPISPLKFNRLSSYVMQDDAMNACLTVFETLLLAAKFQLPAHVTDSEKEELVTAVISELGLTKAKDTCIGNDQIRGVSGGERKRANIGVELVKNPSILFLDEPTSGLDSFQAQSVMECMSNLAQHGRTVIASIHQPRSSIYAMFDQLYLISEGRCIFSGAAHEAVQYFESKSLQCPEHFNPADFFLDITSPDYRSPAAEKESLGRIKSLAADWETKHDFHLHLANVQEADEEHQGLPTYQSSTWSQIKLIFWRSLVTMSRNKGAIFGKVFPALFFALVLSGVYSNTGYQQKSIQDRIGAMFFFAINQTFSNMMGVLMVFAAERTVVERERASNSYRMGAFYVAKYFAELPFNIIGPLIFGFVVYWIIGLNDQMDRFLIFLVILLETGFAAIGFGMFITSMVPNAQNATDVAPLFIVLMIIFGGFYINVESLPLAIQWINYLSIIRWSFSGLAINEFRGVEFKCGDLDDDSTCVRNGNEVLARYSIENESSGDAMLALFLMIIGFNFLAYMALLMRNRKYLRMEKAE